MQKKMNVKLIKATGTPIEKQVSQNQDDALESDIARADGIVPRPYPIKDLQLLIETSSILQQCVEAYRRNIVGFGAVPKYTVDEVTKEEETPEMKAEWKVIQDFVKYFNFDKSFEDVFGEAIEDREITGNGYVEIIRDGTGLPVEGDRINPDTMWITKAFEPIPVTHIRDGKTFNRKRRFRKFIQEVGTKKVYFKEFGDPRKMDSRNGNYVTTIPEEFEATEIIHLKIGSGTYGIPRWIGQLIHMYGARKAEELNYNYFTQGRHTPMAVLLHNAVLSPESEQALIDYAASVEGVDNSHKFLLIEAEGLTEGMLDEEKLQAKVELKSLADMLQNDALFLEYDEASREKVQSSFRLPDIYVGRSKDFNRATADTARYITEEQVFEPERTALEWIINNKLLIDYALTQTEAMFNKPEISNVEEVVGILTVGNNIGAVAPNDVRDIIGKFLGKDLEPFEGDEYNLPKGAVMQQAQLEGMNIANEQAKNAPKEKEEEEKKKENLKKALDSDLISILKDLRDVLEDNNDAIQRVYSN